nr:putative reverse transcriptase domain-containing protein [Tanacetum cinerariifolium]
EEGVSKMMRMLMEEKKDDMGACIEKLYKIGWAAQDPMYDTALLLFGQSADYRKLWLHLKPESCGNWVKSVGKLIQETTEKIVRIKHRMQAAQDRQKNYVDWKRKPIEFEIGDRVMLKVSPWKGVVRFGKRGKLNPRYVRPFKVLAKVGKVAYKLEHPQELSKVHPTFHVSNMKKCYSDEP